MGSVNISQFALVMLLGIIWHVLDHADCCERITDKIDLFGCTVLASPLSVHFMLTLQTKEDIPVTKIYDFHKEQDINSYWTQLDICCRR